VVTSWQVAQKQGPDGGQGSKHRHPQQRGLLAGHEKPQAPQLLGSLLMLCSQPVNGSPLQFSNPVGHKKPQP
jgi:hypothetical protein